MAKTDKRKPRELPELEEEWTGRPSIDQEEQDLEIRKYLEDQQSHK